MSQDIANTRLGIPFSGTTNTIRDSSSPELFILQQASVTYCIIIDVVTAVNHFAYPVEPPIQVCVDQYNTLYNRVNKTVSMSLMVTAMGQTSAVSK